MKKTRLLWSYQIGETEKWLNEQAKAGYQLENVNRLTRTFTFKKGEPNERRFHIDFNNPKQAKRLQEVGWHNVVEAGKWTFRQMEEPKLYPSRNELFKRLQRHTLGFGLFVAVGFSFISIILTFLLLFDSFQGEPGLPFEVLLIIPISISLLPLLIMVYALRYFKREELKLLNIETIAEEATIKKFRFGWDFDLIATKRWLDKMAIEGYEAVKFTGFSVHFKEKSADFIDYEILYTKKANAQLFQFNSDMGWQHLYSKNSVVFGMSIWSRARQLGEVQDDLLPIADRKGMLKFQTIVMSLLLILISASNGFVFYTGINLMSMGEMLFIFPIIWVLNGMIAVGGVLVILNMWNNYRLEISALKRKQEEQAQI